MICPAGRHSPALLLFLAFPVILYSQILGDLTPSNLGGRDSVAGTVFLPNRRPAGRGLLVRINKGGNDASTWTDADGKFIINSVGNGTYSITVDAGEEFERTSQRLEVAQPHNSPPQIYYVNIQLQWKPNAIPKPSVIDAELAGAPRKAQKNFEDARKAAFEGDHSGAVAKLLLAVSEYPEFALAHAELGSEYLKLNQLEKSDEHLILALKLKPGFYEPLANRGVVLARLKKYGEAESVLRKALTIKGDSPVVHFYLGRALTGQKKLAEAETEFRTALDVGGNSMIEARRALANVYLQLGDDEKGLAELEAYLAANPNPADEMSIRGTIKQIRNSLKENRKP